MVYHQIVHENMSGIEAYEIKEFEPNINNFMRFILNSKPHRTTTELINNENSQQPDYISILNRNFDGLSTTKEHHHHTTNLKSLITYLFK
jgi:hypothetical protein